jgi:cell division protein FtsW
VATVIPGRTGSDGPGRKSPKKSREPEVPSVHERPRQRRRETLAAEPSGRMAWLRAVLDRPMTSYQLVLASAGMLVTLGVLMVLSASSVAAYIDYDDSYWYFKRQIAFLVVGLIGVVAMVRMPLRLLRVLGWVSLFVAAGLLVLTYTPLGYEFQGNRNWLDLGVTRLQPSEFAKFAVVVWGADVLAKKQKLLDQPKHLLIPYLPVTALIILLIIFQGDAGTAAVVIGLVAGVLWMVGAPLRVFGALFLVGAVGFASLVLTSANRLNRFEAFLNPTTDIEGINRQATIGMYAIASGGWWGVGLGASRQKWGTLPEAHSDFIFAVIGEELGLFGSLVVLLLFLILAYCGIRIALRSDDLFCRYTAAGVTVWLTIQAMINLGSVLRLLPIAGVPLPLVSYGGSALLSALAAVGLLLVCARNEPEARALIAAKRARPKPRMTTVIGFRRERR